MEKEHYRKTIMQNINLLDKKKFIQDLKKDMEYQMNNLNDKKLDDLFCEAIDWAQRIKKGRFKEENELISYLMLIMFFEK